MAYDAQVYQIADKYDVSTLKTHAKGKFGIAIATGWNMDDFPVAISVVYESTPSTDRGLRDLVMGTSRRNIDKLLGHDGLREIIRKSPDFAADLIPSLCGKLSAQRYECPSCDHQFRGDFSGKHYHCPSCSQQRSDWDSHQIEG
jgi:speckle-type POZ protein